MHSPRTSSAKIVVVWFPSLGLHMGGPAMAVSGGLAEREREAVSQHMLTFADAQPSLPHSHSVAGPQERAFVAVHGVLMSHLEA